MKECLGCNDGQYVDHIPHKCVICDMAKLLKVFADNTRLRILYSLLDSDKCVGDIQEDVNMSQSAVSHQLKVLRDNNLVMRKKESNKMIYGLADNHVKVILEMVYSHVVEE